MIVKIFSENPLSIGVYKELPKEIESLPGISYELSKEELELVMSNKKLKFENNKLVVDEKAEIEFKDKMKLMQDKLIKDQQIKAIEFWFNDYDKSVSQFSRKQMLYDNNILSESEYLIEKEKILNLHKEAEIKAKELNRLRNIK